MHPLLHTRISYLCHSASRPGWRRPRRSPGSSGERRWRGSGLEEEGFWCNACPGQRGWRVREWCTGTPAHWQCPTHEYLIKKNKKWNTEKKSTQNFFHKPNHNTVVLKKVQVKTSASDLAHGKWCNYWIWAVKQLLSPYWIPHFFFFSIPRVCQSEMDLSFMGVSLTIESVPPMLTRRSWLERIQA